LIATTLQQSFSALSLLIEKSDFPRFFAFSTPNEGEGVKWGVYFGVVGKPISDIVIEVACWRYLERFSLKSTKNSKKRDFRQRGRFGAK